MGIIFTKISANRVKIDLDGHIAGFNNQSINVFEHPSDKSIIITSESSPEAVINGRGNGMIIVASEVTTPANTGKTDLVNQLITNYFN